MIQNIAANMAATSSATHLPIIIQRKIGSTTYRVNVHFNQNAKESLEEKVLRLIKNDLHFQSKYGKMESLQAGWLPERSSS